MSRGYQVRTIPIAALVLFYVLRIPNNARAFTTTELTLLAGFRKHAYSGTAICCRSELEAEGLLYSYASLVEKDSRNSTEKQTISGAHPFAKCVISYPILNRVEIVHINADDGNLLLVVRKITEANTPSYELSQSGQYYFISDIQQLNYRELIDGISKRPF